MHWIISGFRYLPFKYIQQITKQTRIFNLMFNLYDHKMVINRLFIIRSLFLSWFNNICKCFVWEVENVDIG